MKDILVLFLRLKFLILTAGFYSISLMSDNTKLHFGYREGVVSVVLNFLLFVLKYYAGIVSASVALTADAWHTLSDSLTSVVVIVSIRLSSRKPDKAHPFGHGRWEQISALIIAMLLVLAGIEFVKDAVSKLQEQEAAHFGWLAYVVTVVSIVCKEGLAQYAFYIARLTGNVSVKADGWHHRSDALSSAVVLAGLFLSCYFWWIDAALGIVVSLMLFYAAYGIIREAVNKILGEEPSEEIVFEVKEIVRVVMGEQAYPHHFHIHNYGDHTEFTFHVKVPGEETVRTTHAKVTLIEQEIKVKMNMDATIHMEPLEV